MTLLLLGCTSGPGDDSAPAAEDTVWFATDRPTAVFTPSEVEAEAERAFAEGMIFPFEQPRWIDALIEEFADDDGDSCIHPVESTETADTWTLFGKVECTGAVHRTYGTWLLETSREKPDSSMSRVKVVHLYSFWGETIATGGLVEGGGAVNMLVEQRGESLAIQSQFGGHFVDSAFDGLLGAGVSGMMNATGTFARLDGFEGTLNGSMAGGGAMVDLDGISFTRQCVGPSGTLSVRDPSGGWWQVDMPDDCGGCGPLSWNGEVVGESCAGQALATAVHESLDAALDNPL